MSRGGPRTKDGKDKKCFDCGAKGQVIGHDGCKSPGERKFGSLKGDSQKPPNKPLPAVPGPKKPAEKGAAGKGAPPKKNAKAAVDDTAASPNARISLALENGALLTGVLDSGATDHFLSTSEARRLSLVLEACEPIKVGSAEAGGGFVVTSVARVRAFVGPSMVPLVLNVADGVAETLLSYRTLMKACPNTAWEMSADGKEGLRINGQTFGLNAETGTWVPTSLTSDEFAARATHLSGTEASVDPASEKTRFRPSGWLATVFLSGRPFTAREELEASTFEKQGQSVTEGVAYRLAGEWHAHLARAHTPGSQETLSRLAWACAAAPSSEKLQQTLCG